MQPQQEQPSNLPNPNPDYNFIFNDQKSKRRFGFKIPGGNNVTKLVFFIIAGALVLGVLIIVLSNIFSPKLNTKQVTDVVARGEEISRVSDVVRQKSRDLNTGNLASTTSTVLTSQEVQLVDYLKKNKKRVPTKDITIYLSKKTDAEIDAADQSNRLSEYYYAYLKKNLTDYQTALKTAYDAASGPTLKNIAQEYSISTQTILKTQQLASN
jgi:hypothetical protein